MHLPYTVVKIRPQHLIPPCKTSSARNGFHLCNSLAKGIPLTPTHITDCCQDNTCCLPP